MSDISGNEFDISGNESESSFEANFEDLTEDPYVPEPQTLAFTDSYDYTSNFENLEIAVKFQSAVIIGLMLCLCFIVGWKRD